MEVVKWWCSAGLIAFGLTWLGLAILCIAALVFDCWAEKETKLTTPLPESPAIEPTTNDQKPAWLRNCGLRGAEISTRTDGGLHLRRRIKVR